MCNAYPVTVEQPTYIEPYDGTTCETGYDVTPLTRETALAALGEEMLMGFYGGVVPGTTLKEQE